MDKLFLLDNFICNKIRKYCSFRYFSENEVIQRFVSRAFGGKVHKYKNKEFNKVNNIIWLFWYQGEKDMPPIVKRCYNSIIQNKGTNSIILLDKSNYSNYVTIPQYIIDKLNNKQITITHFSDILRFNLLAKYGGWWLDSTIFVSKTIKHTDHLFTIKTPYNKDLYISEGKWSGFLWYIPQGHPLPLFIRDCLHKYWEKHNHLITYFFIDHLILLFYTKNSIFKKEIDELPIESNNLYFFQQNTAFQQYDEKVLSELFNKNMFFKCSWKGHKFEPQANCITYYDKILVMR